ncbi:Mfa1 family fimbria major subunit [uncultured Porphyromonas sp.]|uniref:Mfa1 family fimbria major subunit n=1 Tax=uncultured Porphyromonas sp. TaxID=159274 RepID=UPI00262DEA09|nr:Mfa1 family fimbria major subunit [uncultured Porphyromonas sp.]
MRKNFTAVALLCATLMVGMTACNKSNQGPEVPQAGESSYAVLSISLPTANSSRANVGDKHQGETYDGTVAENKVSSVLVGFYKAGTCAARIDLNATHDGATTGKFTGTDVATTSTGYKLVTKAVKVPKIANTDSYDVVVFFNPTEEVKGRINKGASIEDLKRFSNYDEAKVITANGIMMSNAKGIVNITGDKLFDTKEKAEEAAAEKVSVQVERAVAKVFVNPTITNDNASGSIAGAKLKLLGWQLDVTNLKYFPMRVMDQKIKANSVGSAAAELEAETAASERVDSYAKDPNFDAATTTIDTNNFEYLAGLSTLPTFYEAGYDDDKGHYVAENTMAPDAQKLRGTTLVVFKVKVTPTINGAEVTSYVVYKGVAYTVDDFTKRVTKSANTSDADNGMPTGFAAAVAAFADGSATGVDALNAKIGKGKAFKDEASGISLYVGGVNYYHMPIRHFTNEQQAAPMQYGRYGLVRNNIYKLTINSIKNFGDPEVVEPGDENDDPETLFIAMSVELLPWLVRESGYDL